MTSVDAAADQCWLTSVEIYVSGCNQVVAAEVYGFNTKNSSCNSGSGLVGTHTLYTAKDIMWQLENPGKLMRRCSK